MSAPPNDNAYTGPEPSTELGPFSSPGARLNPWLDTWDGLRRAQKYWVSTVRPDGRPHVTPLLGVWALDGLCFCSGDQERKSKNLAENAHVALSTGVNTLDGFDYVAEGVARRVTEDAELAEVADEFEASYGWHLTSEAGTWRGMGDSIRTDDVNVYHLRPTVIFAFGNGRVFSQTIHRWR